jgi:hypothetical protein
MTNETILDPIREAVYNAKREYKSIAKIHITVDFKMRLKAAMPEIAVTTDIKELNAETILGYPAELHDEPCDKSWWLEF